MRMKINQKPRAMIGRCAAVAFALSALGSEAQTNAAQATNTSSGISKSPVQLALRNSTKAVSPPIKPAGQAAADRMVAQVTNATSAVGQTNFVNLRTSPSGLSQTSMGIIARLHESDQSENASHDMIYPGFKMQSSRLDDVSRFITSAPSARMGLGDAKATPDPILGRNKGMAVFTIKF